MHNNYKSEHISCCIVLTNIGIPEKKQKPSNYK